jgi:hypothetical protein
MITFSHLTGFPARRVYVVTGETKAKRFAQAQPFIKAFSGMTLTGKNKLYILL